VEALEGEESSGVVLRASFGWMDFRGKWARDFRVKEGDWEEPFNGGGEQWE
jgi:hypothetical protein